MWSTVFKIHARAYQMLDQIIPTSSSEASSSFAFESNFLFHIDAIVLQWIYGTISNNLLDIILEQDITAETAWNHLRDILSNNKNSRALYLEQEFFDVHMDNFVDAFSYCQHLKSLAN